MPLWEHFRVLPVAAILPRISGGTRVPGSMDVWTINKNMISGTRTKFELD